ncbi:MAG: transposase Tn3 family protein [Gammaproteobacteria bacterium]|nr:transposase Tn3 family protein [Gammaproteobacteria bacterium]
MFCKSVTFEQCPFLRAFKPLKQPNSKKLPREDKLFAVIIAEAMNHSLPKMATISDIPYHRLDDSRKQYIRLATLKAANDIISNRAKALGIFPYYELGFDKRYGSTDGQKYEVERPTLKARYSKKYFGKGRGVVAYTLLCNHVPLQTDAISAHEHESYYAFHIVHHNTSDIIPEAISGVLTKKILPFWIGLVIFLLYALPIWKKSLIIFTAHRMKVILQVSYSARRQS